MTTLQLRSIDIPQLHRFGVGFDKMFDRIDEILRMNQTSVNYPPYNLMKVNENRYVIELAVAGFKQGEVTVEVKENELTIEGKQTPVDYNGDSLEWIHHGISGRDFVRVFTLADYVEVISAKQENGILTIELERKIPEEKKPKQIAIAYTA